jgi:ankyrin repeat protein
MSVETPSDVNPLFAAIRKGSNEEAFKIIDEIISGKRPYLNINEKERNNRYEGDTALGLATIAGNYAIVEKILNVSNIDVNAQSEIGGYTPLMRAFKRAPTPAELTLGREPTPEIVQARKDIINKLLSTPGIDIDLMNRYNETALYFACYALNLDAVEKILKKSTKNINTKSTNRRMGSNGTPLYTTIALLSDDSSTKLEIVKRLLNVEGININESSDKMGNKTPLIEATEQKLIPIIELLLQSPNIDLNRRDYYGKTALDVASENKSPNIMNLLQAKIDQQKTEPLPAKVEAQYNSQIADTQAQTQHQASDVEAAPAASDVAAAPTNSTQIAVSSENSPETKVTKIKPEYWPDMEAAVRDNTFMNYASSVTVLVDGPNGKKPHEGWLKIDGNFFAKANESVIKLKNRLFQFEYKGTGDRYKLWLRFEKKVIRFDFGEPRIHCRFNARQIKKYVDIPLDLLPEMNLTIIKQQDEVTEDEIKEALNAENLEKDTIAKKTIEPTFDAEKGDIVDYNSNDRTKALHEPLLKMGRDVYDLFISEYEKNGAWNIDTTKPKWTLDHLFHPNFSQKGITKTGGAKGGKSRKKSHNKRRASKTYLKKRGKNAKYTRRRKNRGISRRQLKFHGDISQVLNGNV